MSYLLFILFSEFNCFDLHYNYDDNGKENMSKGLNDESKIILFITMLFFTFSIFLSWSIYANSN